jgi:hypothetical protein
MKNAMTLATAAMFAVSLAHADGGAVCLREGSGAFLVTVFVAPQPIQVGPIDVSVLVQDRQTGVVILDAKVDLAIRYVDGGGPEFIAHATQEQSTNKLLKSGRIGLPTSGSWGLRVFVSHGHEQSVFATILPVSPAASRLGAVWPLLFLPPFAIALFALHQTLSSQAGRMRR